MKFFQKIQSNFHIKFSLLFIAMWISKNDKKQRAALTQISNDAPLILLFSFSDIIDRNFWNNVYLNRRLLGEIVAVEKQ